MSTIRNADLIIALDKGEVFEHGTHDDLMEQRGLYYELVTAQTQKEKGTDPDSDKEDDDDEVEKRFVQQKSGL